MRVLRQSPRFSHLAANSSAAQHGVLRVGDDRRAPRADGEGLFVQLQLLENILQHALAVVGIVDGEVSVKADACRCRGAECARRRNGRSSAQTSLAPRSPSIALQPLLQLVRRLVGKGDGQHLPRRGRAPRRRDTASSGLLLAVRLSGVLLQKRPPSSSEIGMGISSVSLPAAIASEGSPPGGSAPSSCRCPHPPAAAAAPLCQSTAPLLRSFRFCIRPGNAPLAGPR